MLNQHITTQWIRTREIMHITETKGTFQHSIFTCVKAVPTKGHCFYVHHIQTTYPVFQTEWPTTRYKGTRNCNSSCTEMNILIELMINYCTLNLVTMPQNKMRNTTKFSKVKMVIVQSVVQRGF